MVIKAPQMSTLKFFLLNFRGSVPRLAMSLPFKLYFTVSYLFDSWCNWIITCLLRGETQLLGEGFWFCFNLYWLSLIQHGCTISTSGAGIFFPDKKSKPQYFPTLVYNRIPCTGEIRVHIWHRNSVHNVGAYTDNNPNQWVADTWRTPWLFNLSKLGTGSILRECPWADNRSWYCSSNLVNVQYIHQHIGYMCPDSLIEEDELQITVVDGASNYDATLFGGL